MSSFIYYLPFLVALIKINTHRKSLCAIKVIMDREGVKLGSNL